MSDGNWYTDGNNIGCWVNIMGKKYFCVLDKTEKFSMNLWDRNFSYTPENFRVIPQIEIKITTPVITTKVDIIK